ncbi:hypothetical protein ERICIV_00482 [Paenibacillus larvae subsp. larvae]|uniref:Uncharacterized protein n=1 Tax=Paenibacillus larvae subsp. larvae TaxID=147375 RepID=A0A2L1TVM7_9BACL|nr:hypothetical protein [Paenibacillus larvae]AVF24715.1 hypothetical protein ERICIII_00482 [Paenibacillus larvae subsp. larvae]AVF29476.1 hypothetical protein ERICIV_00482 [Paenibacillus larvae subsp. larvae]MCY7520851.1 hypothetical protein [Paenibacillus larvae]MCY9508457.1 hypothetical protein [Paenibacillus larvae]MCY9678609.1 hypothetical protein [Paenibacillus larvae]
MKKFKKLLLSVVLAAAILGGGIALNLPQTSEDSAVAALHGTGQAPANMSVAALHGTGQ